MVRSVYIIIRKSEEISDIKYLKYICFCLYFILIQLIIIQRFEIVCKVIYNKTFSN